MSLRRPSLWMIVAIACLPLCGCGKPPMIKVTGSVKLNGKPVEKCKVGFFPDTTDFNPDRHGFGYGITDKEGKFEIQHPQGEKGIYPGTYRVTLVQWVNAEGAVMPPEIKPSEVAGGVRNAFTDKYEFLDSTPERATVTKDGGEFHFDIKLSK